MKIRKKTQWTALVTLCFLSAQMLANPALARSSFSEDSEVYQPSENGALLATETACMDWRKDLAPTFEAGLEEYLRQARQETTDWGCLNLVQSQVVEKLFDRTEESAYEARLGRVNSELKKAEAGSVERAALEELALLLQHRWLTEMYEGLSKYNSHISNYVVGGTLGTAVVLVGGSILIRRPLISHMRVFRRAGIQSTVSKDVRSSSRSLGFKFLRQSGGFAARGLQLLPAGTGGGAGIGASATQRMVLRDRAGKPLRPLLKAPLEVIDADGNTYTSYSELALYRDLTSTAFSFLSSVGVGLWTKTLLASLRTLNIAGRTVKVAGRVNLLATAIGLTVGSAVEWGTQSATTGLYHRHFEGEVEQLRAELRRPGLNDWQRYVAAANLTAALIQWTSTQEIPITTEILTGLAKYREKVACSRLLTRYSGEPELPYWKKLQVLDDRKAKAEPEAWEKSLRKEITKFVVQRRSRLDLIRSAIQESQKDLVALSGTHLKTFQIQHEALLDRLSRLVGKNELVESQIEETKRILVELQPHSSNWADQRFLWRLGGEFGCVPAARFGERSSMQAPKDL